MTAATATSSAPCLKTPLGRRRRQTFRGHGAGFRSRIDLLGPGNPVALTVLPQVALPVPPDAAALEGLAEFLLVLLQLRHDGLLEVEGQAEALGAGRRRDHGVQRPAAVLRRRQLERVRPQRRRQRLVEDSVGVAVARRRRGEGVRQDVRRRRRGRRHARREAGAAGPRLGQQGASERGPRGLVL